jgi:hypothetical protein
MPAANPAENAQKPRSNTQANLNLQISNQSRSDRLEFGALKIVWDLGFGI